MLQSLLVFTQFSRKLLIKCTIKSRPIYTSLVLCNVAIFLAKTPEYDPPDSREDQTVL